MPLLRATLRLNLVFFLCLFALLVPAFGQASSLITQPVDEANLTVLKGNTHPLAQPKYDQGAVPANMTLNRMLLVLRRSPAQDDALRQLLDDQQDNSSPSYHRWLTPDQYGRQFGPSDKDLNTVTDWLKAHGLQVTQISRGRTVIEFSGNVAQVQEAFHTSIHNYLVNGQMRLANASDPQIPAALAPVIAGPLSLNAFPKKAQSHFVGTYSKISGKLDPANPLFTFPGGCDQDNNCYAVVPYDFATIYNVLPLWTSGIDGTGQTIAIVGRTNINIQDVRDFRSLFGLPAKDPQIILNGPDPGINGDESESDIDVQWSGAVAKNATIDFVTSESTETSDGVDLSAEYIVDNNLAPVMSESYGQCELALGTAGNQFFNSLWAQAAAQGITVMVSTGDSGAAGCDLNQGLAPQPAQFGLAVSGIASTPYNVAVGGTDFQDAFNPTTYWNTFNDPTTQASAIGYIPESTWNSTCTNALFSQVGFSTDAETNCNNSQLLGFVDTVAASGGLSNCTSNTQQLGSCSGGYTKPSWQTGTGVPADGKRDLPDVSLFASSGFVGNFYVICQADLTGSCSLSTFAGFGGTSVASPAFAGIMALVNQQMGARQGNANYVLYKLAAAQPTAFHDVTSGTIAMPCAAGTPNCTVKTKGHQYGVLSGYATTTGYDLATGLGSVNAANLVNQWSTVTFKPSTTTLSLTPTTITHGQSVTVNGTVVPATGTGTPSGNVSLLTSTGKSVQDFTLTGTAFSGSSKLLPGGAYTVTAHYGGDPTFGGSDSTPVSVTVSKESSKTVPRMITFDSSGNILSQNATSAAYGSPYILRMDATDAAGDACGSTLACPTGNLTLTDNASPLDGGTFALNNLGYAEDDFIQLAGGVHAIQAVYPGDSSFTASTGSDNVTIVPATTSIAAPYVAGIQAGDPISLNATVTTQSSGAAPAGTMTFLANGVPLAGTITYYPTAGSPSGPASLNAFMSPTIANAGAYAITATYSGGSNYAAATSPATNITLMYPVPTVTLQPSSNNVAAGAALTLTAVVYASSKSAAPTGTVTFVGTAGQIAGTVTYTDLPDGNGFTNLQATLTFPASASDAFQARYSGDSGYPSQWSPYTTVTVTGTDFSVYLPQTSLTVRQGNSAAMLFTVGVQTGAAAVTLNCSGLPAEAACAFDPSPVTVTTGAQITVTTKAPHNALGLRAAKDDRTWLASLGLVTGIFLMGWPRKRNGRRYLLILMALGCLSLNIACGGGSSGGGGGGGPTDPGTPKGSYVITVTGTSGSLTHSTTFTLVVQ